MKKNTILGLVALIGSPALIAGPGRLDNLKPINDDSPYEKVIQTPSGPIKPIPRQPYIPQDLEHLEKPVEVEEITRGGNTLLSYDNGLYHITEVIVGPQKGEIIGHSLVTRTRLDAHLAQQFLDELKTYYYGGLKEKLP